MLRELWRKSCGWWCYLQLADPAKIGKETTILRSLTKKVARICAHGGNPVNVEPLMNVVFAEKGLEKGVRHKRV
jgi:hypothetical protein